MLLAFGISTAALFHIFQAIHAITDSKVYHTFIMETTAIQHSTSSPL
jgi:hypothetical protein